MYVYMWMFVYIYIYECVCLCVWQYMDLCMYMYYVYECIGRVCMYVCLCLHVYIYAYVVCVVCFLCVHMFIWIYVHTCRYMYARMHVYTTYFYMLACACMSVYLCCMNNDQRDLETCTQRSEDTFWWIYCGWTPTAEFHNTILEIAKDGLFF